MSSGNSKRMRVAPSRGSKKGTAPSRKHHFESFTQRISKLKIDPVRRVSRRHDVELNDASASHFKHHLEEWRELNVSGNFTSFAREVSSLSETLPQILHFDEKIVDLLCHYIGLQDILSLEPLLSLTAHLAHDLGARFEKFFSRVVALVSKVASRHKDVEAMEWGFNTLSWLFKYLSRLLVRDLRPTFDLMAPLLGKENQRPFVTRFAAEAMSFLVRKAGALYSKNQEPLEVFVEHVLDTVEACEDSGSLDLFKEGLMTMFANSITGLKGDLHSTGGITFQCLFHSVKSLAMSGSQHAPDMLFGIFTNIAHQTSAETFFPLVNVMTEVISMRESSENGNAFLGSVLFRIAALRKGERVHKWGGIIQRNASLLDVIRGASQQSHTVLQNAVMSSATILSYAPLDEILPFVQPTMDILLSPPLSNHFLPFCSFLQSTGTDRFISLLLPYFQRFIEANWEKFEERLCFLIPTLVPQINMSNPSAGSCKVLKCPVQWQRKILQSLKTLHLQAQSTHDKNQSKLLIQTCHAYTNICAFTTFEADTRSQTRETLLSLSQLAGERCNAIFDEICQFSLGPGLNIVLQSQRTGDPRLPGSLWSQLCNAGNRLGGVQMFLTNCHRFLEMVDLPENNGAGEKAFMNQLITNLTNSSHELRSPSLQLLYRLSDQRDKTTSEILNTASKIEGAQLSLQSTRSICVEIRRLGKELQNAQDHEWLSKVVVRFCFGIFSKNLSPAWDESIATLTEIVQLAGVEEEITRVCLEWLSISKSCDTNRLQATEHKANPFATEHQCFNTLTLQQDLQSCYADLESASDKLTTQTQELYKVRPNASPSARSHALRVFQALPRAAEKCSRQLVPLFLGCTQDGSDKEQLVPGGLESEDSRRWNRKDQMDMVRIFGLFKGPKTLSRSAEVFTQLTRLLSNGDSEMQKISLDAILTWKPAGVMSQKERLYNLLKDNLLMDELSNLPSIRGELANLSVNDQSFAISTALRLLYGKAISQKTTASGSGAPEARRKAILKSLTHLTNDDQSLFIDILLGPLAGQDIAARFGQDFGASNLPDLNFKRQIGMLKMVYDLVNTLGRSVINRAGGLFDAVLYASLKLDQYSEPKTDNFASETPNSTPKSIRQLVYKCLNALFTSCVDFDWSKYLRPLFQGVIDPKLENLPIETAQSPSGLLQLFHTWSRMPQTLHLLVDYNKDIMTKICECMIVPSAKPPVRLYALNIMSNILENMHRADGVGDEESNKAKIAEKLLVPYIAHLVTSLGIIFQNFANIELLEPAAALVRQIAPYAKSSNDVEKLLGLCVRLLSDRSKRIKPKLKSELVQLLPEYIDLYESFDAGLKRNIFDVTSSLFAFFKDRRSRETLPKVLKAVGSIGNEDMLEIAVLCEDLNSYLPNTLDEIDFDGRLSAYSKINQTRYAEFKALHWKPILFNMIYLVKDSDELAIRASSAQTIRRFIQTAANDTNFTSDHEIKELIESVILPDLSKGVRESHELVRAEYMSILSDLIKAFPKMPLLSGMEKLLVDGDEEASFFNNVLHIQQHRRLRALRRLATESSKGTLGPKAISQLLVPLVERFIFDKGEDDSAQNLAAEAVTTIGALVRWLTWSRYKQLLKRYFDFFQRDDQPAKIAIRLIGVTVDALAASKDTHASFSEVNREDNLEASPVSLSASLPPEDTLVKELSSMFLSPLGLFLSKKDEATVGLRVPVGMIIVKLLRLLPEEELTKRLPGVLTDLCHILRSRAQESRDMTRKTLAEITMLLGPSYFGFVMRELRAALTRGYQLHVLSFTVHSLLIQAVPQLELGSLDYCIPQLVDTSMDDIFGPTGQEKDAEEYVSRMKEVKSSKSFDTIELLSRITSLERVASLIAPVQMLLREKINLKIVQKIDEVLRRLGLGLLRNDSIDNQTTLVLCWELLVEARKASREQNHESNKISDYRTRRFLINVRGAQRGADRGSVTCHSFKMTRFALDLLRAVLHKHDHLQTPQNVAQFLPLIGDALLEAHQEVQISAIRLLTVVIKTSLPEIDQNVDTYIVEAVRIIKATPSTSSEIAQAALKLISTILRDRRAAKIDGTRLENQLAFLLNRIKPDLEEPSRQGITFNFLRTIISRKIMLPEVYDIISTVSTIMITSQARESRDLARGLYFQFLMEYPQVKDKFEKQIGFLVKNLNFQYQEGRQSVLEAIHLLISKLGDNLIQQVIRTLMIPLAMILVNDESADCREMAGMLLHEALGRADNASTQLYLSLAHSWLDQEEQVLLRRLALQLLEIFFDVVGSKGEAHVEFSTLKSIETLRDSSSSHAVGDGWELPYYSLQLLLKLCDLFPQQFFVTDAKEIWEPVQEALTFPHIWVKSSAGKLIGFYLADFARANAQGSLSHVPLKGTAGLSLDEEKTGRLVNQSLQILSVPGVSEELAMQTVRNLAFLGKYLSASGLRWEASPGSTTDIEIDAGADSQDEDNEERQKPWAGLHYLLGRLSAIVRFEIRIAKSSNLIPKKAALRLLAVLSNHLEVDTLRSCVETILIPLHHLTDEAITVPHSTEEAFRDSYQELQSTCHEIMSLLQKRLGTGEYVQAYSRVQQEAKSRRQQRRVKRTMESVMEPEKAAKQKKRRDDRAKVKRKERSADERGRRRGW